MPIIKRILYILWPLLAGMILPWTWISIGVLSSGTLDSDWDGLRYLPPHRILKMLWSATRELFISFPLYASAVHLLLAAAIVWWYARPKATSGWAVFYCSIPAGSGAMCLALSTRPIGY